MKKTFVLLFLMVFLIFFSQQNSFNIHLVKDYRDAEIFKGKAGGKPITLFLKFYENSGWHDKVFSVAGWYYYDAYKIKIPLFGFYNGDLKLYHFKDEKYFENIPEEKRTCWSIPMPCPTFDNYEEFIEVYKDSSSVQKGFLTKKNQKFTVELFTDNLDITKRNEYLHLSPTKKINLYNVLDEYGGNKVVSTYFDRFENRVMLYYERDSNFNKHGFCGADIGETGYRLLTFDKNWKLIKFQVYSKNSCITDALLIKPFSSQFSFIKAFYIQHKNSLNLLIVNTKNSTFGSAVLLKNYDHFAANNFKLFK